MELHFTDAQLTVQEGQVAAFDEYTPLQRSVVPVFAKIGNRMVGRGSAVCVAPGLFVTARHVVAELDYNKIPAQWALPYDLWIYLETDESWASDLDSRKGGLMPVSFANAHTEVDLATLTVQMNGESADWLHPVTLGLRMPELGEFVECFGYDLATAQGDLDSPSVQLVLERRLSVSFGRVTEQQPKRRPSGVHRASPGFRTTAATPSGMSGGPVFDADSFLIGFNSGSSEPAEEGDGWDSFAAGAAAALELNFLLPMPNEDPVSTSIETRTRHVVELVGDGEIACALFDSFDVDSETGATMYRLSGQAGGIRER